MNRFRRMQSAQKFVAVHFSMHNHFQMEGHPQNRNTYKLTRAAALAEWRGFLAA